MASGKHFQFCRLRFFLPFLLGSIVFSGYGQTTIVCSQFTITGTSPSPYFVPASPTCIVPITPTTTVWTNSPWNGFPNGFVKHTFNTPQTDVSVWYEYVNSDDYGTITINGGGVATYTLVSGCATMVGNVLGPFNGIGSYGDVQVNIKSTLPFTEITLVNTGGQSGHGAGDCNSVTINAGCNVNIGADTALCEGSSLLLSASLAGATYLWQDGSTSDQFTVTQPGKYWVQRTNLSCVASDTIYVTYNPIPVVSLGNDTTFCNGWYVLLDASTPNGTYVWQDQSTHSTYWATEAGTYSVAVTVNRCTGSDDVTISTTDCEAVLIMPNLFSPNGDHSNDTFVPIVSENIVFMKTTIYNRWGEKVFETDNHLIEWDGDKCTDGMYYWFVTYSDFMSVERTLKGWVHMVK